MEFRSILFNENVKSIKEALTSGEPGFFVDLNLDQIINGIAIGKEEYNLKPFFYTSP